ncbi:UPF0548 protein [Porphyridium purpureum]|uniref:UPF0548 protein n=1 Tax=Porphyridium purpureum TaxID=35688 RepID=A0A5J4YQN3_PORPP|nr:UPF0548 protein [Porphyridium purpureum]|eukprot:POR9885..scf236_6
MGAFPQLVWGHTRGGQGHERLRARIRLETQEQRGARATAHDGVTQVWPATSTRAELMEHLTHDKKLVPQVCARGGAYVVKHTSAEVGCGEYAAIWPRAVQGIESGDVMRLWWTRFVMPTEVAPDRNVVVLVHPVPLLPLSAAMVCNVLYKTSKPHSYAIGWLTTARHLLHGEERLRLDWIPEPSRSCRCKATDSSSSAAHGRVVFEIVSYSRSAHPVARIAQPMVRWLQDRFAHGAIRNMQRLLQHADKQKAS